MSILNINPPGSPTALGNITCVNVPGVIYDKIHNGDQKSILCGVDITSKYISVGRESDRRSTLLLFEVVGSERITREKILASQSLYTRAILDKYYGSVQELFLIRFTGI